jgi:hypothetical protein
MELQVAAFLFFKKFPTMRIAATTSDADMEFENFFLIAPKNHRCEVSLNVS